MPKELIPKPKHLSPMQPYVPGSCYIRNWTGRASNVCPHQDMCNKREIIPGGSMMLASSLSLGTRCSPERSLEQRAELALLHWRHFQGSSGPALASGHGQSDLELRPYLSLSSFFMESKQKYDPAAFCSSEMAFWSNSQPLKQPTKAEVGPWLE